MPTLSNFPNGFPNGVTIRNAPIVQSQPGAIFWVYNGTALQGGQKGGSDGNKGTYNAPFASLNYAITQCVANRGDIIFIKPGHVETVSSATALNFNIAGVGIVGMGQGTNRPKFTLDTANTATIPVSAANMSIQNCQFFANFLSISSCFTLAVAAEFAIQNCYFKDTSGVLNFLNIVKSTGAANTVDGLSVTDSQWASAGTTSVNAFVLTANDIDRLEFSRNKMNFATTVDQAMGIVVTTGVLTNADIDNNRGYRKNTTTANGSLINVGGTTSTGWVSNNKIQTLTTTSDKLFTTTVGLSAYNNLVTGVVGASGFLIPAADS
jgi:hypothetical protein